MQRNQRCSEIFDFWHLTKTRTGNQKISLSQPKVEILEVIKIKNKKAQGLSLRVIIIGIICLMVLIVVLAIFYSQTGRVADSLSRIGKDASDKAEEAQSGLDEFFTCEENDVKCSGDIESTCKDGKWSVTGECGEKT